MAEFPAGFDTSVVEENLTRYRIIHHMLSEEEHKVLLVLDGTDMNRVRAVVTQTLTGKEQVNNGSSGFLEQMNRTPVVMICLALSILGAMLVD